MKKKCIKTNIRSLKSKAGDHSRGWPEGSLFDSYYTKVQGRALLLSLDCSVLPLIRTLQCWVLSKEASSTIFCVFGMTRPGIELRSLGPLANTLTARPMSDCPIRSLRSEKKHEISTLIRCSLSFFLFSIK